MTLVMLDFDGCRVTGVGRVELHGSEPLGVNADGDLHQRAEVAEIEFVEEAIMQDADGTRVVAPGRYTMSARYGLCSKDKVAD